jgi:hypothetical protein
MTAMAWSRLRLFALDGEDFTRRFFGLARLTIKKNPAAGWQQQSYVV